MIPATPKKPPTAGVTRPEAAFEGCAAAEEMALMAAEAPEDGKVVGAADALEAAVEVAAAPLAVSAAVGAADVPPPATRAPSVAWALPVAATPPPVAVRVGAVYPSSCQ